jgi:predicted ArsR family transcriptional regulator
LNAIQSFSRTRQLLLLGIKRRVSASVVELAGDTYLSSAAARRHLGDLARDGYLSITRKVEGPGRPRCFYSLTGKGESVFAKNYKWVADAALLAVKEEGPGFSSKILRRMAEMNVASGSPRFAGKPDLDRVCELERILTEQGFFPVLNKMPDGAFELLILNCPMDGLLTNHPELCQMELSCFERAFEKASVTQSCSRRRGDPCCEYLIRVESAV